MGTILRTTCVLEPTPEALAFMLRAFADALESGAVRMPVLVHHTDMYRLSDHQTGICTLLRNTLELAYTHDTAAFDLTQTVKAVAEGATAPWTCTLDTKR